jgi:N-acyl homoserine lactone hydrolase
VRVTRLHLTDVHPDPALPWANGDVAVFAYLIEHPDGLILVDTGVGEGNELIDALYRPEHHDLAESIAGAGHRIEQVSMIINSHLHFDHCGNNRLFPGIPIVVQQREYEAAHEPYFTDPEWVDFPGATIEQIEGDRQVANGVRIISTPGHTPGHQSVVVDSPDGRGQHTDRGRRHAAEIARPAARPRSRPRLLQPRCNRLGGLASVTG